MFVYWQGYEIDGSDSAYNLVLPDVERCLDVARFLLALKIVRRDRPFILRDTRLTRAQSPGGDKRVSELEGRRYDFEALETLIDGLRQANLASCRIVFEYQDPNHLYPNITAEILAQLCRLSGAPKAKFVNPGFRCLDRYGEIELYFDSRRAQSIACEAESVSEAEWALMSGGRPSAAIEVYLAMATWQPYHQYSLEKLNAAFPGLIDYGLKPQEFSALFWYPPQDGDWLEHYVLERIDIDSADPVNTLRRIADVPGFAFSANTWARRRFFKKSEQGQEIAAQSLDLANPDFQYYNGAMLQPEDRNPSQETLKGIFGKALDLGIEEYAVGCRKLIGAGLFDNAAYEEATRTAFEFTNGKNKHRGWMYFARPQNPAEARLCIQVPWRLRADFCRKFGL